MKFDFDAASCCLEVCLITVTYLPTYQLRRDALKVQAYQCLGPPIRPDGGWSRVAELEAHRGGELNKLATSVANRGSDVMVNARGMDPYGKPFQRLSPE